jgi:hypothetical protein
LAISYLWKYITTESQHDCRENGPLLKRFLMPLEPVWYCDKRENQWVRSRAFSWRPSTIARNRTTAYPKYIDR